MVVLQKYYEVIDRPSREVNKSWKVVQILIYLMAALSGIAIYCIYSDLKIQFGDNCILYPTIKFTTIIKAIYKKEDDTVTVTYANQMQELFRKALNKPNVTDVNNSIIFGNFSKKIVIDQSKTIWGNDELCYYYEYVPIMSMIVGVILITFFCMCPRGGSRQTQSGIKQPWIIVPIAFLCTGIFALIAIEAYIGMSDGVTKFCAEFESVLNTTKCNPEISKFITKPSNIRTSPLNDIYLLHFFLSLSAITWLTALVLLICRTCCFMIDFKMMEVIISDIEDESESNKDVTSLHSSKSDSIQEHDTEVLLTESKLETAHVFF